MLPTLTRIWLGTLWQNTRYFIPGPRRVNADSIACWLGGIAVARGACGVIIVGTLTSCRGAVWCEWRLRKMLLLFEEALNLEAR